MRTTTTRPGGRSSSPDIEMPAHTRLSETLHALSARPNGEISTISGLIRALDEKAFAVLVFLFAAINVIPALPGTSGVLGLPLVFVVGQRVLRRPVRFPAFLMRAALPEEKLRRLMRWLAPKVGLLEMYVRPRMPRMFSPAAGGAIDLWMMVISLSVLVPLPFTAMFPAACVCLIALGRMERDGLLVATGCVLGVLAVGITMSVLALTIKGAIMVLNTPL